MKQMVYTCNRIKLTAVVLTRMVVCDTCEQWWKAWRQLTLPNFAWSAIYTDSWISLSIVAIVVFSFSWKWGTFACLNIVKVSFYLNSALWCDDQLRILELIDTHEGEDRTASCFLPRRRRYSIPATSIRGWFLCRKNSVRMWSSNDERTSWKWFNKTKGVIQWVFQWLMVPLLYGGMVAACIEKPSCTILQ